MQREQLVAGKCLYNLKTGENYKILYLDWPENVIYAVELGKTIAYPVALTAGKVLEADMEVRNDEMEVRDGLPQATGGAGKSLGLNSSVCSG